MLDESTLSATPTDESTPAVTTDTPVTPAAVTDDAAASATTEFLRVNDRTVYRNAEDARKGYEEAQQRIAALSEFEKAAKEFGVTDPKQVQALLNELYERQQKDAQTPPAGSQQAQLEKAVAGDRVAYDSLSPEWKAQYDWLKRMGLVTDDKLTPLEQRLSQLEAGRQSEAEARVETARNDGFAILADRITKSGLPSDDDTKTRIGKSIANAISDGSRDGRGNLIKGSEEDRFINGSRSDRESIIDEHLKWFTGFGEKVATSKTAAAVAQKTANIAATPRALPAASNAVASATRKGPMTPEERSAKVRALLEAQQ